MFIVPWPSQCYKEALPNPDDMWEDHGMVCAEAEAEADHGMVCAEAEAEADHSMVCAQYYPCELCKQVEIMIKLSLFPPELGGRGWSFMSSSRAQGAGVTTIQYIYNINI